MEPQKQSDLLSIIIPVYNVKDYLTQCLDSVRAQTYPNFEVILVDDGSTDGSGEICKKYAGEDDRIQLISQRNQGVVTARKNGILAARGTYLGFVDADDYIDADLYQRLMDCGKGFDLVISQWLREEGNQTRRCYDRIALGAYKSKEDLDFLLAHLINVSTAGGWVNLKSGFSGYIMTKLYRTQLLKAVAVNLNQDLTFGEDSELLYRYFLSCNSVLITDICGYHYRIRENSASHAAEFGCEYLKNVCMLYETLLPVFQSHPRSGVLLSQLQLKIASMIAKAPAKMGFSPEAQNKIYVFPFINQLDGKRIALYGGGLLGQTYRRQIIQFQMCHLNLWVDKDWREYQREGIETQPAEELLSMLFDFVVLGVPHEDEAVKITEELVQAGVAKDKILWKKPLIL